MAENEEEKKIPHANGNQKKAGVAVLNIRKKWLWTKNCKKKQGRSLYNDKNSSSERIFINIYASVDIIRAPKWIEQIWR